MIVRGELKLRIHKTCPLAEAQQAHRDLEGRRTTGKLLLTLAIGILAYEIVFGGEWNFRAVIAQFVL
jgi:hypothetical protein